MVRDISKKIIEINYKIADLELKKALILSNMCSARSMSIGEDKVQTSHNNCGLEDGFSKISEIEETMSKYSDRLVRLQDKLTRVLREAQMCEIISENAKEVLAKRYIDLKPWDIICNEMAMNYRTIRSIERRAFDKLEKASIT